MSMFPTVTKAPVSKTKDAKRIALFYVIVIVVFVVAQLFTYDEFPALIISFGLPGGEQSSVFLAALLVAAEVFALPFLLRMPLSKAFRYFSMGCGWLVAGIWLFITAWLALQDGVIDNIGFLGTAVAIMPGWWAVFVSAGLAIVTGWSSWGMWPGSVKTSAKKQLSKR
ncbi:MAG: hypothetical protein WA030_02175 [Candidatus Microsaccharimonas sp.]